MHGRILIIAPSAYPLGGVATWLDGVIPGLRERGWDVLLGLTSGRFHDVDAYLARHPCQGVVRLEGRSGTSEGRVRCLAQILRRIQPAIAASVNAPDLYIAIDRLRRQGGGVPRAVMTLHGLQADLFGDIKRYGEILDAVIATNRLALTLAVTQFGLDRDRAFYAPYGVQHAALLTETGGDQERPLRIAFVGRLNFDQKRIEDIPPIAAELARRNVSCEWLIAGAGPQEGWLRRQLGAVPDAGTIHFLGNLTPEELENQVYRQADVLLITSSWETGPIVAWEAMAHGVVVVTSNYVGSRAENSLREGENCLFFPVGDPIAAARRLEEARDPELRRRLAAGGMALIRSRYSIEASIDAWSQCFSAIMQRPPRGPAPEAAAVFSAGRLDRLFGVSLAETLREITGREARRLAPGDEWPHTHSPSGDGDFLALAAQADRAEGSR